jgi:DNA-binding IscR family transcriptional regulator
VEECVAYPIWKKIGQYIECLLKQVKLGDLLRVETEKDKKKLVETITAGCC